MTFSVGALGIVNSATMMLVITIISINMAIQPIIGFNYGAGYFCRVKEVVTRAIKYATLVATGGWLICMLIPGVVISMFNSDNMELRNAGVLGLRIYTAVLPVVGFQIIASNYFQAIGKAKLATFLSLLRQIIVLLPGDYSSRIAGGEGGMDSKPDFRSGSSGHLIYLLPQGVSKLSCDQPVEGRTNSWHQFPVTTTDPSFPLLIQS